MSDNPILLDIPEHIVGERILLRSWLPGDGVALFEAIEESREHILPWLPWGPWHDQVETTETRVREWNAHYQLRDDMAIAILNRDQSRILGGTGLHRIDWHNRSFEIGYWIRQSEHGKGYVTEAVKLLTDFAFDHLEANRVFIRCATTNVRSNAVPKRLGFIHEGTTRQSIKDTEGVIHDVEVYSLIKSDRLR